jgi:hypothetical protein
MGMSPFRDPWSETMRKFFMLALAGTAALAVALPASAQPGYRYDGRDYDGRNYDRQYDRRGGSAQRLLAEINQLYSMVDRDLQYGRMNKSQAKKYFRRLDGDRDRLMRDRRDGYVRPDTEREVARDLADIQRAYREFQRNQRRDYRW